LVIMGVSLGNKNFKETQSPKKTPKLITNNSFFGEGGVLGGEGGRRRGAMIELLSCILYHESVGKPM